MGLNRHYSGSNMYSWYEILEVQKGGQWKGSPSPHLSSPFGLPSQPPASAPSTRIDHKCILPLFVLNILSCRSFCSSYRNLLAVDRYLGDLFYFYQKRLQNLLHMYEYTSTMFLKWSFWVRLHTLVMFSTCSNPKAVWYHFQMATLILMEELVFNPENTRLARSSWFGYSGVNGSMLWVRVCLRGEHAP